jgi:uroporphyrinogen-III synthase
MSCRTLYLGLHAPAKHQKKDTWVHLPIIQIVPTPFTQTAIKQALTALFSYTHIIFTSQSAVPLFFDYATRYGCTLKDLKLKIYVAVGSKTAAALHTSGIYNILVATNETAEGVTEMLQSCDLKDARFFWPHSALSRPAIKEWLEQQNIPNLACVFYDTVPNPDFPKPDLASFDEIVFTSPSTVDAFLTFYGTFPPLQKLRCIGPITKHYLEKARQ